MKFDSLLTIKFQGAKDCCLIWDTQVDCRCPTCDSWTRFEDTMCRDSQRTFAYMSLGSADVVETSRKICPNHVMKMGLISRVDRSIVTDNDMTMMVRGQELDRNWQASITVKGSVCMVSVEIKAPVRKPQILKPLDVVGSPSKIKVTYTGAHKCFLIYYTDFDCGCDKCRYWLKYEVSAVKDNTGTYGAILLDKNTEPTISSFTLCWDHELRIGLVPESRRHSASMSDLKGDIKGWRPEGVMFHDKLAIGSEVCEVSVEVSNTDDQPPSYQEVTRPREMSRNPETTTSQETITATNSETVPRAGVVRQSPAKLRMTFNGSKNCYLIFDTKVDCGCDLCQHWLRQETTTFQDSRRTYGAIALDQGSIEKTYSICWSHVMKMGLIPWARVLSAKQSDLTMDVRGQSREMSWQDRVFVDSATCGVFLEVLPVDDLTRTLENLRINSGRGGFQLKCACLLSDLLLLFEPSWRGRDQDDGDRSSRGWNRTRRRRLSKNNPLDIVQSFVVQSQRNDNISSTDLVKNKTLDATTTILNCCRNNLNVEIADLPGISFVTDEQPSYPARLICFIRKSLTMYTGVYAARSLDRFVIRLSRSCVSRTLRTLALMGGRARQRHVSLEALRDCLCALKVLETLTLSCLLIESNKASNNNDSYIPEEYPGSWAVSSVKTLVFDSEPRTLDVKLGLIVLFPNIKTLSLNDMTNLFGELVEQHFDSLTKERTASSSSISTTSSTSVPLWIPFPHFRKLDTHLSKIDQWNSSRLLQLWIQKAKHQFNDCHHLPFKVSNVNLTGNDNPDVLSQNKGLVEILTRESVQIENLWITSHNQDWVCQVLASGLCQALQGLELFVTPDSIGVLKSLLFSVGLGADIDSGGGDGNSLQSCMEMN
ncbi:hypothetical protein BGZ83_006901 [Gryganskiella cystojenkinii]|nr:hypothetical protein BGZ83_006901 [Gryganskiella cystojenkinii]